MYAPAVCTRSLAPRSAGEHEYARRAVESSYHPRPASYPWAKKIVRLHVEGSFGIGKSSALSVLEQRKKAIVVPEPMRYWRTFFEDLVSFVGQASETIGSSGDRQMVRYAQETMASLQMKFADPYLILHERLYGAYGSLTGNSICPDLILAFDRHPVASTACFPAARFLKGDCTADSLFSLLIKTPREPPGCNILVCDLADDEEHVRRVTKRGRPGEAIDTAVLTALRAAYRLFVNTVRYANHGGVASDEEWREMPWLTDDRKSDMAKCGELAAVRDYPRLEHTLIALLKTEPVCQSDGVPRHVVLWAVTAFLKKLVGMTATLLCIDGKSREEIADDMASVVERSMLATKCSAAEADDLVGVLKEYSGEVGGM